jgi:elongation factor 1 alpha-like protein
VLESTSTQPRGGLLGGSSKTSKLAALAASRKKKNEEKKQSQHQPALSTELGRAVGLLDRLGKKKPDDALAVAETKIWKTPSPDPLKTLKSKPSEEDSPKIETNVETPQDPLQNRHCSVQQGQPTAFAQTLFGNRHTTSLPIKFRHPYIENPRYISADPFAKPSPDDIVIAAQSKGSWNA